MKFSATEREKADIESARIWPVALATAAVSLIALILGASLGYPSPVLLELQNLEDPERRFTPALSGLFGASSFVGATIAGPVAGWVADKCGRKVSLMLCALPFLFGYFLIVSASIAYNAIAFKALLIAGMFIAGIGTGWSYLAVPVYIGEISSAKLRTILSFLLHFSMSTGTVFAYAIGLIPSFRYYHVALVMEGVILVYVVMAAVCMTETPRWLLLKNRKNEAKKVLLYLHGPRTMNTIECEIQTVLSSPPLKLLQVWNELIRKPVLVPLALVVTVLVIQDLDGGGSVIKTYAAPIFKAAGINDPELLGTFAVGGTQLIATVISIVIVHMDLLGRKTLLIVSATGMLAGSAMLGTHFYITRPALCSNNTNATGLILPVIDSTCNSQYSPLAITSLILFVLAYSLGWGPVPWVIMSEYLPLKVKGVSTAIIGVTTFLTSAIITGIYPIYVDLVNPWFAWWTFAIVNLAAIVFVLVFLVETKGKSLEDIQKHFEQKYAKSKHYNDIECRDRETTKLFQSTVPRIDTQSLA